MSRSYKKNPYSKDGGRSSRPGKQMSSRAFRRDAKVKIHTYRYDDLWLKSTQAVCSYDVNDYISYYPKSEAISDFYDNSGRYGMYSIYESLYEALQNWEKYYRRK
jgi:hypothetical protein